MLNEHFAAMNSIYDLFEANAKLISKKHMGLNPAMGRLPLLQDMFAAMQACKYDDVRLQSITEKYGRMSVYYEGGDDTLYAAVKRIMDESIKHCVICGALKADDSPLRCAVHKKTDAVPSTVAQLAELDKRMKKITRMASPEFEF